MCGLGRSIVVRIGERVRIGNAGHEQAIGQVVPLVDRELLDRIAGNRVRLLGTIRLGERGDILYGQPSLPWRPRPSFQSRSLLSAQRSVRWISGLPEAPASYADLVSVRPQQERAIRAVSSE